MIPCALGCGEPARPTLTVVFRMGTRDEVRFHFCRTCFDSVSNTVRDIHELPQVAPDVLLARKRV